MRKAPSAKKPRSAARTEIKPPARPLVADQTAQKLSFAGNDDLHEAISYMLLARFARATIERGKPLTGNQKRYVLELIEQSQRQRTKWKPDERLRDLAEGFSIDVRAKKVGRKQAIAEAAQRMRWPVSRAVKAHTLFRSTERIKPKAGPGSEK